jgi:AcrR family transcriptional regulator
VGKKAQAFDDLAATASGTRELLFLRAVQLFSDKGCDSVGIRELCTSGGIMEASFCNHYAGKEDLLNTIFAYWENVTRRAAVGELEHGKKSGIPQN